MNRRDRRANGQRGPRRLSQADIWHAAACPDCNADVDSVEVEPGFYQVFIAHDDTCPWFPAFKRHGGFGIRFGTGPAP